MNRFGKLDTTPECGVECMVTVEAGTTTEDATEH